MPEVLRGERRELKVQLSHVAIGSKQRSWEVAVIRANLGSGAQHRKGWQWPCGELDDGVFADLGGMVVGDVCPNRYGVNRRGLKVGVDIKRLVVVAVIAVDIGQRNRWLETQIGHNRFGLHRCSELDFESAIGRSTPLSIGRFSIFNRQAFDSVEAQHIVGL